jgi:hypothetical protein
MTTSDADEFPEIRKRVISEGTIIARQAAAVVRPINEKIGAWQAESIRLEASARRMRETGRSDPGVIEAIATLLDYVETQRERFENEVAAEAAAVGGHNRIADTRQALVMVIARLRRALEMTA